MDINAIKANLSGLLKNINPFGDTNPQLPGNQNVWTNAIQRGSNWNVNNTKPLIDLKPVINYKTPGGLPLGQVVQNAWNNNAFQMAANTHTGVVPLDTIARSAGQMAGGVFNGLTAGLYNPVARVVPQSPIEKGANLLGNGFGMFAPIGIGSKVLSPLQTATEASVASRLAGTAAPSLVKKIAPIVGGELAQNLTYAGLQKLAGQRADIPTNLAMSFGMRGAFGGLGKVLPQSGMVMKKNYDNVIAQEEQNIKNVITRYELSAGSAYDPQNPKVDLNLEKDAMDLWKKMYGMNRKPPEKLDHVIGQIYEGFQGWKAEQQQLGQGMMMGFSQTPKGNTINEGWIEYNPQQALPVGSEVKMVGNKQYYRPPQMTSISDLLKEKQGLQTSIPQGKTGQPEAQSLGLQSQTPGEFQGQSSNISSNPSISQDVRGILTGDTAPKERKFITSVKESDNTPTQLKQIVEGTYVPKSNDQLIKDAQALIKADPQTAEQLALNPTADVHIQVGNELIQHYASMGDFAKAKQIAEGMANAGTDLGRSVQAFSLYDKTTPSGAIKFAQSKVDQYNRAHPNSKIDISNDQVKGLFDKAHKIQQMPQGRERNIAANELMNEVNKLIPSSIGDKAITVWKAGLLTSLRTTERNLVGNTLHQAAEVTKDTIASPLDKLMSFRTGKRSMTFTTKGLGSGTVQGLKQAKDIVQLGYDPQEAISKYDVQKINWGNNPVEKALKAYTEAVFRTLGAQDKPFWNAAFARSLYDQAGAEAINAGKQGDKVFIKGLVDAPTEEMLKVATKDANVATFHDENGFSKVANAIKQQLSKNELTKIGGEILAPFTGVPSSIAGQISAYSPLGLVKGIAHVGTVLAKDVPSLQRQAAQEVGRGVIGTGLLGVGAYLASKGLMTGQPRDIKQSQQWQLENKPANSVLIGGKWRSINSIGPENLIILAGAKAQEELQKGDKASLGTFGSNIGKDFLGQTFLQGVQQPLAAINDPARYGQSYLGNQLASAVPNIVKDTAKSMDPNQRENNSTLDYLTNSLPFLRNNNIVRRDNLGNIMPQEPTGAGAFLDLLNSKTPQANPVIDELSRLDSAGYNATPSKLNKSQTINGEKMKLTPQQLDQLESQVGPQVTQSLKDLIASPDYQALSDEEKANAIGSIITQARKQVRGNIDLQSNTTPSPTSFSGSGKYTLINPDTGNVRHIDLTTPITSPQLTGNTELDKKLISGYNTDLTQRAKDIVDLYKANKITAQEAETQLATLKDNKITPPKKARKLSIRAPKIKLMKTNSKSLAIKTPKAPKISFGKAHKSKTLKFKPIRLA